MGGSSVFHRNHVWQERRAHFQVQEGFCAKHRLSGHHNSGEWWSQMFLLKAISVFFFFLHFLSFLVWMKSSTCFLFTQKAKRHKLNMIQDSKGRHALKKRRKAMRGRETDFWKQTCPWYRFIQSPYLMKDISIDPLHNLGCFLYVQLLLCTHRMRSILTWNI